MNETSINLMKLLDRYIGVPLLYILKPFQALFCTRSWNNRVRVDKILMVKLWGIGNLVMIIPLIRAVRKKHPAARICFLTIESNRELLKNLPELDEIVVFEPKGVLRTAAGILRVSAKLRRFKPDIVLDFEQFLKITPILALISGTPQSVGFETEGQARSVLHNVHVPYRKNRHMSLAFGDIVRSAGISTHGLAPLDVPRSLEAAAEVMSFLKSLPEGKGPVVVVHPGSGDNFPARRWPVENFAALCAMLVKKTGARCVVTGTEPERELGERLAAKAGVALTNAVSSFNIMEFIELLGNADLLITNDTAPVHIGSALNVPLIAFFGPNTPELYGPLHDNSRTFYNKLPCSPCLTNMNAKTSRCRIPSCILDIEPKEVFDAALEILSEGVKKRENGNSARENPA